MLYKRPKREFDIPQVNINTQNALENQENHLMYSPSSEKKVTITCANLFYSKISNFEPMLGPSNGKTSLGCAKDPSKI